MQHDSKFLVKKSYIDDSNLKHVETNTFQVAKPALSVSDPPDEIVKKVIRKSDQFGFVKFDNDGFVKPCSVIGDVDDFLLMAKSKHDLHENKPKTTSFLIFNDTSKESELVKEATKKDFSQGNALENWQRSMEERQRIYGRISKLVPRKSNFDKNAALMNSADGRRKINEIRTVVDRAIPSIDYGKGFRSGSEFWRLHENIGDETTGLKMTLTKNERGLGEQHIERISKPADILEETTSNAISMQGARFFENPYLKDRLKELHPVMVKEHAVGESQLFIKGEANPLPRTAPAKLPHKVYKTSTPAVQIPDHRVEPKHISEMAGPLLKVNNRTARYSERADIEERVLLQTSANNETCQSTLRLENLGSTRISFHFRRLDDEGITLQPPRFFFNRLGGTILPGEILNFPFQFKSNKPGIFTESWVLVTEPKLLSGETIQIRLYAIAYDTDKMFEKRKQVKKLLSSRESKAAAMAMFDQMLNLSFLKSEEKQKMGDLSFALHNAAYKFHFSNSGYSDKLNFTYRHDAVEGLCCLWQKYCSDKKWDYDIDKLKSLIMEKASDEEVEIDLEEMNETLHKLRQNYVTTNRRRELLSQTETDLRKQITSRLLNEFVYQLVDSGTGLRQVMKIPEPLFVLERGTASTQITNRAKSSSSNRPKSQEDGQMVADDPTLDDSDFLEGTQYTNRLESLATSLFANFTEKMLDLFD